MNSRTFAILALAFSGLLYVSTSVIAAEPEISTEKPGAAFYKTAKHKKVLHKKHHKAHHKARSLRLSRMHHRGDTST